MPETQPRTLGVVIAGYLSDDVIVDCLESLATSENAKLRVVVVDNASPDDTAAVIRTWATESGRPFEEQQVGVGETAKLSAESVFALLRLPVNLGFAGGINTGVRALLEDPAVDLFWVLNPDCVVTPGAAAAYLRHAETTGPFALMGSRTLYHEPPQAIQTDGGRVNRWTGVCRNANQGGAPDATAMPAANTLNFVSGANVVASRTFIERAGLLQEDYFLYFEEVDWAMRRGDLPLTMCPDALVLHHGGTSIGTGSVTRRASGFANYFNYRNRMRFMRRFFRLGVPSAFIYSLLKVGQLLTQRAWSEADGALRGLLCLPPPRSVRERLSPEAARFAFGKGGRDA